LYVIILGAPGAGKGTQAEALVKEFGLVHVATGDLFRNALNKGTELGLKAKEYMEKGVLVPDEITTSMVLERIANESDVLLDGFPRNVNQAAVLDKALDGQDKGIDKVVYVRVSEAELVKRLSGRWICRQCQTPYNANTSPPQVAGVCDRCGGELYQRADDTPETVKKRLEVYFNETAPVIDYYKKTGKLLEVDGEGDMSEISGRIIKALRG
jgi:adenylate kinase